MPAASYSSRAFLTSARELRSTPDHLGLIGAGEQPAVGPHQHRQVVTEPGGALVELVEHRQAVDVGERVGDVGLEGGVAGEQLRDQLELLETLLLEGALQRGRGGDAVARRAGADAAADGGGHRHRGADRDQHDQAGRQEDARREREPSAAVLSIAPSGVRLALLVLVRRHARLGDLDAQVERRRDRQRQRQRCASPRSCQTRSVPRPAGRRSRRKAPPAPGCV